jgi:hypothetical protein
MTPYRAPRRHLRKSSEAFGGVTDHSRTLQEVGYDISRSSVTPLGSGEYNLGKQRGHPPVSGALVGYIPRANLSSGPIFACNRAYSSNSVTLGSLDRTLSGPPFGAWLQAERRG